MFAAESYEKRMGCHEVVTSLINEWTVEELVRPDLILFQLPMLSRIFIDYNFKIQTTL